MNYTAVSNTNFFGREKELLFLDKRLKDFLAGYRQNLAIFGPENIGKTYLLEHFFKAYPKCVNPVVIYLTANPNQFELFIQNFCYALVYSYLKPEVQALPEGWEDLFKQFASKLPQTAENIQHLLSKKTRNRRKMFEAMLASIDLFVEETHNKCILVIDGFHHLDTFNIPDLYRFWSKHIMLQKDVFYILVSCSAEKTSQLLSSDLSLLFGNFATLEIKPFDCKRSEEFIRHRTSNLRMSRSLREFLVDFTGGSPFYISIVCEKLNLVAKIKTVNSISYSTMMEVLEELLVNDNGVLNRLFLCNIAKIEAVSRYSTSLFDLLFLIAEGSKKVVTLAHLLQRNKTSISQKVQKLMELRILKRNGSFYYFQDRLFAFWLNMVYKARMESFLLDSSFIRKRFRKALRIRMTDYIHFSKISFADRIKQLFESFNNETIVVDETRFKMHRLKEIKSFDCAPDVVYKGLIGMGDQRIYVVGVKEKNVSENDVEVFAMKCKNYRFKKSYRIFITAEEIDHNIRLLAKELNMYIWTLRDVNHIMSLYNQPLVMV